MTTKKEPAEKPAEQEPPSPKTPTKTAARRKSTRTGKKKPKQPCYDHIPIIIFLLVIFSFTLFCIGIGLTRYLGPDEAGIPSCGRIPCPSPFTDKAKSAPQKGGGE